VKDKDGKRPSRKLKGFENVSVTKFTFKLENGTSSSVAAYFKANYGVTLKQPNWPCARISKTAVWPIELCVVAPGQKYTRKLDPEQTAASLE
jgi:eukaryotic translation initiation factor 2C